MSERANTHCVTSKFENLVLSETQLGSKKHDECRERIKSHQDMISNFLLKGHGLIRNYLFKSFAKVDFSFLCKKMVLVFVIQMIMWVQMWEGHTRADFNSFHFVW